MKIKILIIQKTYEDQKVEWIMSKKRISRLECDVMLLSHSVKDK